MQNYVHPNEMTPAQRKQRMDELKYGVARSRLRYYEENPSVKRGPAYEEAKRIMGRG